MWVRSWLECVSDMLCPYGGGSCWACFPYGAHGGEFQIRKSKVHIESLEWGWNVCFYVCVCVLLYGAAGCLLMVRVYKNASECESRGTLVCDGSDHVRWDLLPSCKHVLISVGEFHGSLRSDLQAPGFWYAFKTPSYEFPFNELKSVFYLPRICRFLRIGGGFMADLGFSTWTLASVSLALCASSSRV